jgi:hypothetical protein
MITSPDLEGPRRPAKPSARPVHDWSRSSVEARLKEAVRLRRAERELERAMLPEARAAFNRAKRKERARAFGALFDWRISGAGFPIDALSPRDAAGVRGGWTNCDGGA